MFLCQPAHGERGGESGDGRGQTRGPFRGQVDGKTGGGSPIIKDGLFEPRRSIEAGSNPIAGLGHSAGDPGVSRFVGSNQAESAQVAEEADKDDGDRGENRGEACFRR